MPAEERTRILFLCTGNSCRSQMAEGWTRYLLDHQFEVYSAGIEQHGLNPLAVQVMSEVGVDISGQQSKTVEELPTREFDLVVTVCSHADQHCPSLPGAVHVIHVGFDDPPALAAEVETPEERIAPYRRVRDEIRSFVERLPHLFGDGDQESGWKQGNGDSPSERA